MSESPNLQTWPENNAAARIPANNNSRMLQAYALSSVISATTTAQPTPTPDPDAPPPVYIIPASATGSQWSGFDEGDVAIFYADTWTAFKPFEGLRKTVLDEGTDGENWQYLDGAWAQEPGGGTGVASVVAGTGIDVDATDPANPVVDLDSASIASLALADSSVQPADSVTTLNMATARLLGRSTASAGAVEEITLGTNLSFTGTTLNAAGGGGGGGGDVVGPASAVDDHIATYDSTTGKLIQDGGVTIAQIDPRGKHAVPVTAGAMSPSSTGGCAPLATIASAANQPDIQSLNFDPSTVEYAQFSIAMPASWDEGTVTFAPIWSHAATTTNFGVVWQLQGVAVSNDDTILANYGTAQTSTDTGGTTSDIYIGPESSAITLAGTPAAGDVVFFRIGRLTSNGSDTMAIDARLHGIVLYMTTNAPNDA